MQTEPRFSLSKTEGQGRQLAASAQAEGARAAIESAYTIAYHRPRSVQQVRQTLLQACERQRFAEAALWTRKIGGEEREGLSIRFAEAALQAWGNVRVSSDVVFEDETIRKIAINVLDLETNIAYSKEVTLEKTMEKTKVWPDQEVISKRTNTEGKTVYLVRATEAEMTNKVAALESKVIRNAVLRLVPQDILEECKDRINEALGEAYSENRDVKIRALADAYRNECGVSVRDLESFLGHELSAVSSKELATLRGIFTAIRDGEAVWKDFSQSGSVASEEPPAKRAGFDLTKFTTKKPEAPLPPVPPAPAQAPKQQEVPPVPPQRPSEQAPTLPVAEALPRKRGRPRKETSPSLFSGETGSTALSADIESPPVPTPEQEELANDPVYLDMVRTWEWKALEEAYRKHCGPNLPPNATSGGIAAAIIKAKREAAQKPV